MGGQPGICCWTCSPAPIFVFPWPVGTRPRPPAFRDGRPVARWGSCARGLALRIAKGVAPDRERCVAGGRDRCGGKGGPLRAGPGTDRSTAPPHRIRARRSRVGLIRPVGSCTTRGPRRSTPDASTLTGGSLRSCAHAARPGGSARHAIAAVGAGENFRRARVYACGRDAAETAAGPVVGPSLLRPGGRARLRRGRRLRPAARLTGLLRALVRVVEFDPATARRGSAIVHVGRVVQRRRHSSERTPRRGQLANGVPASAA